MPGTLAATTVSVESLEGLKIFLYQMGGQLYNDGGYSIALDENVALDAFEDYSNMFSQYKCSVQYDLTRFRTGEIPIYFGAAVTTYNTLMSYYDIRGLWKMAPLLGVENEEGEIDCTSHVTVTALVIPRGANNPAATWEYMKWTVSPETQKRLAKERLAVNANPTTKYNSPTRDALLGQAWTEEEYEAMQTDFSYDPDFYRYAEGQMQKLNDEADLIRWLLESIREYPGNYIIKNYVNSAFLQAYTYSSDASDELLDRILYINKEISRKRDDFKMDYFDASTGEYVPGRYINEPIYDK